MIFELEDMDGERGPQNRQAPSLPFLEQPAISRPARPSVSKSKMKGLPESFASLRPSSLPNPSHIRPVRSPPGVDSSNPVILSPLRPLMSPLRRGNKVNGTKSPTKENAGARAPVVSSEHQGSWSSDGQTWHAFSRGHTVTSIKEENENDNAETTPSAPQVERPDGQSGVNGTSVEVPQASKPSQHLFPLQSN